jgi:hypothetical protein
LADLTIMAECPCMHSRELYSLSLRRRLGAGVMIAEVRAKLRCHKCQRLMLDVRIYQTATPSNLDVFCNGRRASLARMRQLVLV